LNSFGAVITVVGVTTVGVTPLKAFILFSFARSGNDPVPGRLAMYESPLKRVRRRVGVGMCSVVLVGTLWSVAPGVPVWREPSAPPQLKQTGLELFRHEWEPNDPQARGDGLGPVYNARSCVACHFQGGIGGSGDNSHNVTAFETFPTQERPEIKGGLVHRFATDNQLLEGSKELQTLFPLIPHVTLVVNGCQTEVRDFNPVHFQRVNSPALFGAGWIDRISEKTIRTESAQTSAAVMWRELGGDFRVTTTGRPRILPDGRVGKFGWKAQFATLQEFVAAASANEIGLGNPVMPQARPMACRSGPATENDLNPEQFRALVAFVDTLPRPIEAIPDLPEQRDQSARGRRLFDQIGCAICHVPDMGSVRGVYSDFLLHQMDESGGTYEDASPVPLPEDHPRPNEWKTPPLWGVADSAPYFHDGSCATLEEAIRKHSGDAKNVVFVYDHLYADDRAALIAFLKTLRAPHEAVPAPASVVEKGKLAMK
jgi:mono/diheme cytochrome c family protein